MNNHTTHDSEKNHIANKVQEVTLLKNQINQLFNQRLQEILGEDYEFVTRIEKKERNDNEGEEATNSDNELSK
jgi:hypothetical protein